MLDLLKNKSHILIFTHLSPDGDAMGSSLGLRHWLLDNAAALGLASGAEVHVITPNAYPSFLAWLPGAETICCFDAAPEKAHALAAEADLMFCVDFNEAKRIGDAAVLLEKECPKIMIDHHLHPDMDMVDLCYSKPEAPAAAFVALELINQSNIGMPLSFEAATCLYCGLMTDTGNFSFNSTNPVLYEMIAQLLRSGVRKDEVYDRVFNQFSASRMELMGYCLFRKMRIFKKYHTALITLSSSELRRFNFQKGDAEGLVNLPLQIADVYYSVFMREDVDKIKISFRSQGDRPVNEFAHAYFNGGGHANASGGESYNTLDTTIKTFEEHYQEFFKKD